MTRIETGGLFLPRARLLILIRTAAGFDGILCAGRSIISQGSVSLGETDADWPTVNDRTVWDEALEHLKVRVGVVEGDHTLFVAGHRTGVVTLRPTTGGLDEAMLACQTAAKHSCTGYEPDALTALSWLVKRKPWPDLVLSAAVPESRLMDLERWITDSGLRFVGHLPVRLIESHRLLRTGGALTPDAVRCRVGMDHVTLIAGDLTGEVVLRNIDFGLGTLASVFSRAAQDRGMEVSDEQVWHALQTSGISWQNRDQLDELTQNALPMLAPVLQRLHIELKQTMKYRVGDASLVRKVVFSGPGTRVPGLCESIAQNLELVHEVIEDVDHHNLKMPISRHALGCNAMLELRGLARLLPLRLRQGKKRSNRTVAVLQGAAVALVMVVGEGLVTGVESQRTEQAVASIQSQVDRLQKTAGNASSLDLEYSNQLERMQVIRESFGDEPYWPAAVWEMLDQRELTIESLSVNQSEARIEARLTGHVPSALGEATISDVIQSWESAGVVAHAEPISMVRASSGGDKPILRFTLRLELERFPIWYHEQQLGAVLSAEDQP